MSLQALHGVAVVAGLVVLATEAAVGVQVCAPEICLLLRVWPAPTLVLPKAILSVVAVGAKPSTFV